MCISIYEEKFARSYFRLIFEITEKHTHNKQRHYYSDNLNDRHLHHLDTTLYSSSLLYVVIVVEEAAKMTEIHDEFYLRYYVGHDTEQTG